MISKRHAQGIQHLIGLVAPGHSGRYRLTPALAEEIVSALADLTAEKLGQGLNGVQVLAEWEHNPPVA